MTGNGLQNQNWYQIIIVLLLATGAYFVELPLRSDRPPPSGSGFSHAGMQKIEARMWQDPFGAIQDELKSARGDCKEVQVDAGQIRVKPCQADSGSLQRLKLVKDKIASSKAKVLFALVPGGNSVGTDEARRRKRYATLAGINARGYVPEDPEHIGLIAVVVGSSPYFLPFEWFRHTRTDQRHQRLLLLWLDEQQLLQGPADGQPNHRRPLEQLSQIRAALGIGDGADAVIGPSSSTFLEQAFPAEPTARLPPFPLWYSPYATTPLASPLFRRDPFQQVNADDRHLAGELSKELDRRLFFKRLDRDEAIVLVGQWDTTYSRTLRNEIRHALQQAGYPGHILEVSFMQGIDGVLPRGKDSDAGKEASKDEIEHPYGQSQIDYLRRMAQDLRNGVARQVRIRAVGIIGDDYHDKLLALKALKPQFPSAVFFTTDLNAAMLHPADNRHTRNLVVASGYHLSLAAKLQQDIPPFRDSYQTAGYFATQAAIHHLEIGESPGEVKLSRVAHIFEIGRNKAVDLVSSALRAGTASQQYKTCLGASCASPHPDDPRPPAIGKALILPALALSLLLVLASSGWIAPTTSEDRRRHLRLAAWALLALTATSLAVNLLLHYQPAEREPFGWLQGVSIWPSEFIRLIALVLTISLIWQGQKRMRESLQATGERFFPSVPPEPCPELNPVPASEPGSEPPTSSAPPSTPKASQLWDKHVRQQYKLCFPPRLWHLRSCANLLLFVLAILLPAGLSALWLGLPISPVRGEIEFWFDKLLVAATVLAFLLLVFYCLQSTHLAIRLAKALAENTRWPAEKLRELWPDETQCQSQCLDDWLDTQLIAAATVPVQRLIFWPFAIITLLLIARTALFDAWDLPPMLIGIFGGISVLLIASAMRLRLLAEKVRQRAISSLQQRMLQCLPGKEDAFGKQIGNLLAQVKELRSGAFAPFTQQPLVKSALTLGASLSGLALLDYASLVNF